ncbi:MAG: endonuclease MutS2 [Firmicutes bacterium]|nr:endonuclease MutS2 [Bacillota bacterium]MDD7602530.1 endonuclease MutS2 [Bacillota bacterium]MDY5856792.1 endonuclease MutS2 [Anaerovoracaceae bacterium]
MNKKTQRVLEYDRIIDLLRQQAGSAMAKEIAGALRPVTDIRQIREGLAETSEAVNAIVHKGAAPLGEIYEIEPALQFCRKGGSLTMKQLLQVLYNIRVAANVSSWFRSDLPELPILQAMAEVLVTFPGLADQIDRCILSEDEMADNASPQLRDIRRSMVRQNEAIRSRLAQIITSTDNKTYLQDAIVTMRDGRYVVPVKAEHRSRIPGIVHDQSSTGATIFIEPQVIVNLNNELRELELAEKAEIERILAELSSSVAEHFHDLMNNQKLLIQMDVIFAKGKLSVLMRGEEPAINESGLIDLKQARHPLIDPKKVVPIHVTAGGSSGYRTLVVTGPNTGGKTVTLKTVGLLAMMAQSGLHIPALSTSQLPVFRHIFADIGDEQSIEQSLSTFSSHMKNIVEVVKETGPDTLVLLDELGAGTDPTEGAALAIAVLERLRRQGATTIATTHYNELKKYALSTEGVENASMEFDVETLSPTYRLSIGIPGKSNAFEISRKLGLPAEIIDRAAALIERGDIEFEDVISAIEADRKQAEAERDEAAVLRADAEQMRNELKRQQEALEKQKREILEKAREEARLLMKDAKETAAEVQKELKELAKLDSLGERTRRFEKSRKKIREKDNEYAQRRTIREVNNANPVAAADLKVGDRVKLLTLDQNGEILTLPDEKGDLMVQVGIMKIGANLKDLVLINDGTRKKKNPAGKSGGRAAGYGSMYKQKAMSISITCNVQGQNLEDACFHVDKYLDDAYMAGLKEVTIIHGRGEGILKDGIRSQLKRNRHVASFRKGAYNEGGEGVTIVKLKE